MTKQKKIWSSVLQKIIDERESHSDIDSGNSQKDRSQQIAEIFEKPNYEVLKLDLGEKSGEVVIAGNEQSLAMQISLLNAISQMSIKSDDGSSPKGISERRHLSGHPKIVLVFRQVSELLLKQKAAMESKFSLTLTDYSEYNDGYGLKVLSNVDLKAFANKIKSLFLEPELFKLERGKEGYSYQDWKRGYGSWSNFLNKESAFAFYQKYVQIKGDTFIENRIGVNPNTYKNNERQEVQVLNESHELPLRYQKATLALWYSYCYFPVTKQKIILTSRSNRQQVDSRLL